jgi:hypothetical protein
MAHIYVSLIAASFGSRVWEFVLAVAAGVVSTVIVLIISKTISTTWWVVRYLRPTGRFWQLNPGDPLYAASLRDFDPSEYNTLYLPTGDALALAEIDQSLSRLYPEHEIDFYAQPDKPHLSWRKSVILIGGGLSNITTRCLLAALNPPLDSRDHEYPDFNFKGLKDRDGNVVCTHKEGVTFTKTNGSERLNRDWAFVIRAPDPRNQSKYTFIIAGGYTLGTYGAARWVSQPSNLRWLWRHNLWHHLRNYILLTSKSERTDCLQVLLRVSTSPTEPSITESVADADIEVCDENMECWDKNTRRGGKPIYFRTPTSYADDYRDWADKACTEWRS